jgi:hypothetical protein
MNNNSIGDFLRQGELSELTKQALRLQKLQTLIKQILPPEIAAHCQAVSFANSCLLLEVSNSSIATLLRYHIPTLLTQIRQQEEFASIASIKQQIKPVTATVLPDKKPKARVHVYSKTTQTLLTHLAERIPFEPLKQALLKLADHGNSTET